MEPHRIRLKGPWRYRWLNKLHSEKSPDFPEKMDFPAEGTVQMPTAWQKLFGKKDGVVQFERRFQSPTNLEAHQQVAIVFGGMGGSGAVSLNGQLLGKIETSRHNQCFDITDCLQPSNVLTVEITCHYDFDFSNPAGLYETVVIEISQGKLMADEE